jgi:hypothetical protein
MLDIGRDCPFVLFGVVVLADGFHRSGHWAALRVPDKGINLPADVATLADSSSFLYVMSSISISTFLSPYGATREWIQISVFVIKIEMERQSL